MGAAVTAPLESLIEILAPPRLVGRGNWLALNVEVAIFVPNAVTMEPFAIGTVHEARRIRIGERQLG